MKILILRKLNSGGWNGKLLIWWQKVTMLLSFLGFHYVRSWTTLCFLIDMELCIGFWMVAWEGPGWRAEDVCTTSVVTFDWKVFIPGLPLTCRFYQGIRKHVKWKNIIKHNPSTDEIARFIGIKGGGMSIVRANPSNPMHMAPIMVHIILISLNLWRFEIFIMWRRYFLRRREENQADWDWTMSLLKSALIPCYLLMIPVLVNAELTEEFDILETPRWKMALEIVSEEENSRALVNFAFHIFARRGVHEILKYMVGCDILVDVIKWIKWIKRGNMW